jgi:hypothetical protein
MSRVQDPVDHGNDSHFRTIVAHVERHVGAISHVVHSPGPALVHVDVLHVRPTQRRPWHTLMTCGMSRRPMCPPEEAADCRYTEIFLRLPPAWPVRIPDDDLGRIWPFIELAHLARLPHLSESWLWWGHTIAEDPPAPLAPQVPLSAWILGPPRSLKPAAREIRLGSETVRLHSALPIYAKELEVARIMGAKALFRLFAVCGVTDLIDVRRPNCVGRTAGWSPDSPPVTP